MATKPNRVEVEIVATDEASPKIDRLEKKIDGLESDEARVVVTADITRLEKSLAGSRRLMEQMEGDELTVQTRVTGRIEEDLENARRLFNELDGKTGTVTITANTADLEAAARRASNSVDDIGRSASSSRSVLANAIGNSTQDLGALGGVAGTTGVAIGQMGEYMADALSDGERFGVVLRNFALVAGPIAAVTVGLQAVSSIMNDMRTGKAAEQAFDDAQVKEFTAAIRDARGEAEAFRAKLEETGQVLAETGERAGPAWADVIPGVSEVGQALGLFGSQIDDLTGTLNKAGITSEQWARIVTSDEPAKALDILKGALEGVNIGAKEHSDIITGATRAQENYKTATENAAIANEFFERSGLGVSDAATIIADEIDRAAERFKRFGSDGVEQMGAVEGAADSLARQLQSISLSAFTGAAAGAATRASTPVPSSNVTIINPPGTPAMTAGQLEIFLSRNGDR